MCGHQVIIDLIYFLDYLAILTGFKDKVDTKWTKLQSTLVISTSVISNHRLSRRENLVLVFTPESKIRLQNIVEKSRNCSWGAISPLFHNIFNIYL